MTVEEWFVVAAAIASVVSLLISVRSLMIIRRTNKELDEYNAALDREIKARWENG